MKIIKQKKDHYIGDKESLRLANLSREEFIEHIEKLDDDYRIFESEEDGVLLAFAPINRRLMRCVQIASVSQKLPKGKMSVEQSKIAYLTLDEKLEPVIQEFCLKQFVASHGKLIFDPSGVADWSDSSKLLFAIVLGMIEPIKKKVG